MTKSTLLKAISIAAFAAAFSQPVSATVINDDYWGGNDTDGIDDKDVIGSAFVYDIDNMKVNIVGTTLRVTINTNYAGKADQFDNNTGYGDLFLSETWAPHGAAPYKDDTDATGTVWSHALSLDGDVYDAAGDIVRDSSTRMTNVNNSVSLFELSGSNDDSAILSDDVYFSHHRAEQEVIVDRLDAGGVANAYATDTGLDGLFTINDASDYIHFEIDIAGTDIEDWTTIALHWTMTCANDVIEGEGDVPEPAILGLLAIGLLGFGVSRRRKS